MNIWPKIKQKIALDGLSQLVKISLNRICLKFPFGDKIIHRPYYISSEGYPLSSYSILMPEWLKNTPNLSDRRILFLSHTSTVEMNPLIDYLQENCQSLTITSPNNLGLFTKLSQYDLIFLGDIPFSHRLRQILQYSYFHYLPTFSLATQSTFTKEKLQTYLSTDFVLTPDTSLIEKYPEKKYKLFLFDFKQNPDKLPAIFTEAISQYKSRYFPKVTIISTLDKAIDKSVIQDCWLSYVNQSYLGEIQIIIVDLYHQLSGKDGQNILEKLPLTITISESIEDSLSLAIGDLILFTKSNYYLNEDYVKSHVISHSYQDCDVSIGNAIFISQEANLQESYQNLDKKSVANQFFKRDPINPHSFVNISLNHLGLKRKWVENNLDILNLEDLELGYQLYQQGLRLQFTKSAFTLSTQQVSSEDTLPSITQLSDLLTTYPQISLVVRRWLLQKYPDLNLDNSHISLASLYNQPRQLKILTYPWHISHQYELYKLPYQFTLITDVGTWSASGWNLQHRPIPENIVFKSIREINPQDYDLAILHFDENVLSPEQTNGKISKDWGDSFKFFREKIDLPKVAICHGTPQFYGQYDLSYDQSNLLQTIESEKEKLVNYLGDILVINNSHQAQQEWNFKNSKVIWHGFDPTEFPPTTYTKGILSPFGEAVTSRPHYRGYQIYQSVLDNFPRKYFPSILSVPEPHILLQGNEYAQTRFSNYVDNIREYSIYFNPTIRSPMPRSRGEAMMCGLVTVSLKNHDVDMFIDNGINGFYGDTPAEIREIFLYLLYNPQETYKIGQRSRELAMDIFNHDRYLKAWHETLLQLI